VVRAARNSGVTVYELQASQAFAGDLVEAMPNGAGTHKVSTVATFISENTGHLLLVGSDWSTAIPDPDKRRVCYQNPRAGWYKRKLL